MIKKGIIDMQKILQVNKLYYPWIGGVETIVQQIAEGLNTRINADGDADRRGLIYENLTYRIREAIFDVYNKLGPGHKESIYQKALEEKLKKRDLSFEKEKRIGILYKEKNIGIYRPDFIIESKVIVEIKALSFLGKLEEKQIWSYLKGSNYRLALLANFGTSKLQIRRIVYDLARDNNPSFDQYESASTDISVNLRNDQRESAFKVEVLACQPKGKGRVEEINGVKIYKAASFGMMLGMPISLEFFRLFKKLAKENDLIFLHHPYPMGFLAYYLFGRSKKMVVWYHSDIVKQKFFGFLFSPILKAVLKKSQKIFVSNPNLVESSNILKKFQKKCAVVPFGIKSEFFQESDEILKQAKEIRKKFGEPLVLAVGRLTNYKGFEYLIEASNSINAKFLLIGDGALKNKLLCLIRRFRLEDKFFIIPPVSDLLPYYHACDVFVLPSIKKSEAFGIVLLEAMACAKPVISTQLGTGTSFVNQDKKTGFVVEPKNSLFLDRALNDLIANSALRSAFGQRAKERAGEFTLEKFLEKVGRELVI